VKANAKLLQAGSDVVIRFKGHSAYKTETGALKALRRRVPGLTPEKYRACFDFFCRVYERAVAAIEKHRVQGPQKQSQFAEAEDIDAKVCEAELNQIEPNLAMPQKEQILAWVIYWHYLR
jgi:hypothetical protein